MARRQPILLRLSAPSTAIAVICCFVFLLLTVSAGYGLDPDKRLTQYIHKSWRTQDGSLPSGMFSIAQTSDGFLWFLSLAGYPYRFDGVRFVPWHFPSSVSDGTVGMLFADHANGLWVEGGELFLLKNGAIASHFAVKGLHGFQTIAQDPDGSLWVGTRASEAPLCHVSEHEVKCFGKDDGIDIPAVNAVLADGTGGFWLGGPTALIHWRNGSGSEKFPVKDMITSLALGPGGTIWVGVFASGPGLGLEQLKDGALKPFVTPDFDGSKVSVTSLLVDKDGNLWVATDANGLFRIHGNTVEHYGHTEGLSGDSVWALSEDREGMIWAGTTTGVDSFRDPTIATFSSVEGLGKDLAAGILASKDGSVWVANAGSLDRIKDGAVTSIRKSNGLPGEQVAAMLQDRAGNLWVGVDDGLYLFKDGHFRRLPEPDRKPLGMVLGITEDIDGNIWAECASHPSKLVRIRDFQIRETFPSSDVPPGHNLAADPHGGIWILTSKGPVLFRYGKQETTVPLEPSKSPLNRQIMVDADGSILVGSENGLLGWRAGKLQRMTTKNGLPCDFVIAFTQDKEKRWWLYTRCGVIALSDAELQKWWDNPNTTVQNRLYDTFDGAQPNIGSFNAAATTPDGRVWFSSGVVVQTIDPSSLSENILAADAYIESVAADRKEFPATENLRLAPHVRDLQIDYTSPTFSIPQRVKFRYRLEGFDRDWHEAGTRRQAFYTDLPPGEYTFRVMACNSDGVWNGSASTLDFSIAPAYYQTAWFRALCVILFLALLWASYEFRVRQLRHQFEITLDARVSERTRIARDLHDTLLQSAHGILLRFQTVSQLLPDRPVEAKEKLDNAIEQTAKFVTEARDEVQGLRDSTVQGNDLARAISTLGEELATDSGGEKRTAFRVAVEGQSRKLHPIIRDEVFKIAAEALRNAFRHAEAQQIEVEIRYDSEQFRLRIRDDGKGIDEGLLAGQGTEGHFGLRGMRERATLIGGKLTVWSKVDAGTELELCIPARKAYAAGGRGSWFSRKFAAKA